MVAGVLGCHNISPPPVMLRHHGPAANPQGTVRLQLLLAYQPGVLALDDALGVVLQSVWQADRQVALGASVAQGWNLESDNPTHPAWLSSGRLFVRAHPSASTDVPIDLGLGAGTTQTGVIYLTGDLGVPLGGDVGPVTPYGMPVVAVSVPVRPGAPVQSSIVGGFGAAGADGEPVEETLPETTLYLGVIGGVTYGGGTGGTLELHGLVGLDGRRRPVLIGVSGGPQLRL